MALNIQTVLEVEDVRKRWDQAMAEFVSDPEVQQLWKRKHLGLGLSTDLTALHIRLFPAQQDP